ncbi:bifunctional oligoribonuclease/PAP phosphatase NrnA [bacterium]|nr:bifunctional oligoribonuclease/PAP phosphatase NrnA [bacterium]
MENLNLDDSIKTSKNILIISHVNPDGDTLGSMLALRDFIQLNYKKRPEMMVISKIPKMYEFLNGLKDAKHLTQYDNSMVYDLVFLVDVAALDRIFDAQIFFEKAKIKACIDHHKTNNYKADIRFVKDEASSTGEVLCEIAENYGWKFDEKIAEALYTAILTDTGGFRFDNTSALTLKTASKLIAEGAKPQWIYKNCYEKKSKNFVMFQAYCLNKAEFAENDKIAYITVYKKDIEKFASEDDLTEGLVEKLRSMESTEVAFLLKEIDNKMFKVSMRSKNIDVAEVTSVFNGGGHKFAAGCVLKYSAEDCVKKLLAEIRKQVF